MRKLFSFIAGVLFAASGWLLLQKFEIHSWEDLPRPGRDKFSAGGAGETANAATTLPPTHAKNTVRIATFNIQVFGESKSNKPHVMECLAQIVRQFDIVAVQEICAKNQDLVPNFVDLINSSGRHFDFVIGPRLGRNDNKEQYAFLFDLATVEVDRSQLYTVADPDQQLHRPPLVAWFRVRGPATDQAFTFTLVNVHTEPDEAQRETDVLADVYRAVRDDGRREDDVIILGDFNVDARHLGRLGKLSDMTSAVSGVPTDTCGTHQRDQIVFSSHATTEFTGRSGVFDFLREYNLSMEEALEISDHLPVWAEFSVFEGGQPGRIAVRADTRNR